MNERKSSVKNENLSKQIEKKRADLIEVVKKEGLASSLAIQYSQELDRLLNQYLRLSMQNRSAISS
ncbi:aspartyl-phosphate phosphatase Spo0E family protein [Heyndrickxia vini]|uniref:Aspartyl-phosphate phosphatase Spo0E family protein n=1 Tax=Heyndrickxia vini TaxID=1476025 RepID=A0ABX7DY37_9BACI|nr:aspartyl-phosphate phosphatase Spo0E family protein [Heyndrickxia vini]QQZ07835.1 aspartyl-phosphate phosphatase Spo0E family protein [Heyndrickxia vini]